MVLSHCPRCKKTILVPKDKQYDCTHCGYKMPGFHDEVIIETSDGKKIGLCQGFFAKRLNGKDEIGWLVSAKKSPERKVASFFSVPLESVERLK
ncbi:MAG: hypothetical protein JEZ06_00330 [Anaerolineaceae bacterium]|nr:hypothetical protein [Anaerolineaceae bacterium]